MRVLLDTHALIWSLSDPSRLSDRAAAAIRDLSTAVVVSAASAWEIATKTRIGKLPGGQVLVTGFDRRVARLGASLLPVEAEHALLAGMLEWDHRDPFDRVLAAQSICTDLPLVTCDAAFATLAGLRTLW